MKIENLTPMEKVELAQRIWDSVADNQEAIELSDEQTNLLNERLSAFENDKNFGSSWTDVKRRIAS
jgi:putative addiction module component (TIGR02574 family)